MNCCKRQRVAGVRGRVGERTSKHDPHPAVYGSRFHPGLPKKVCLQGCTQRYSIVVNRYATGRWRLHSNPKQQKKPSETTLFVLMLRKDIALRRRAIFKSRNYSTGSASTPTGATRTCYGLVLASASTLNGPMVGDI